MTRSSSSSSLLQPQTELPAAPSRLTLSHDCWCPRDPEKEFVGIDRIVHSYQHIIMDKTHSTHRKNKRPLRSQQSSQNEPDAEENRSGTQKMPLRDKCCQTDHHHHGCCEPEHELEPGDPPLLQRPVQTSKSGIQQIIECFRSGTKQLKHILLKEVDTIFECRTCRSLFRGLPNLITHKQFYCLPSVSMDGETNNFDTAAFHTALVAVHDEDSGNPQSIRRKSYVPSGHPDDNSKQSQAIRDLLEAIYPKADKQEYVITLEPIETNPNAFFQSASNIDNLSKNVETSKTPEEMVQETPIEEIKLPCHTEVVEPQPVELTKKNASLIASDEEHTNVLKPCSEMSDSHGSLPQFTCSVCAKVFNTRRAIYRHVSRVHKKKLEAIRKRCVELQGKTNANAVPTKGSKKLLYVAQTKYCHECHKTFATATNVRRHIEEVHKGIRREPIVPAINVKPKKPLHTQAVLPKKSLKGLTLKKNSSNESFGLSSFKCPHCKRKYSSQVLLKKHLQMDHKTTLSGVDTQRQKKNHNTSKK